jgi:hypothetical protein
MILFPAHLKKSPALCRVATRDLRLVLNPSEGASRRGEAKRAYSQNNDMINLFLTEAGFSGVANRGVRGSLEACANRESEFDQAARAFIQWAGVMTPFSQMSKGAPNFGVKSFELRDGLGKFLSHVARAPLFTLFVSRNSLAAKAASFANPLKRTAKSLTAVGCNHRSM